MTDREAKTALALLVILLFLGLPAPARGFRFNAPADGAEETVGSANHIEVDAEGVEGLMAVLFTASGILQERLDAFPPWTWTVQIPRDYIGSITFSATGRVLGQKSGWAPHAEITIRVVLPSRPMALAPFIKPPSPSETPGRDDRTLSSFGLRRAE